jgi:DNA adenine methylase
VSDGKGELRTRLGASHTDFRFLTVGPRNTLTVASLNHEALQKPLLRWAGGKHWLLPILRASLPKVVRNYFEPFLGGGAAFFGLQPQRAHLADKNEELISMYKALRDDVEGVIRILRTYPNTKQFFYRMRDHKSRSERAAAARTIYLNRTCWNGLYRVNSSGKFNTPFGKRAAPDIVDSDRTRSISKCLQGVALSAADFEAIEPAVQQGDFIYLDPPYISGHQNNGFLMYNAHLFSWGDQERLAAFAIRLKNKGASVIVSNADHQAVTRLYKGFHCYRVVRNTVISGFVDSRGKTTEAVLSSYPLTETRR